MASKRTNSVLVRLTPIERAKLEALAKAEHRALSNWVENRIILEYERLCKRDPSYPEHPEVG
jgi:hypothetical protein